MKTRRKTRKRYKVKRGRDKEQQSPPLLKPFSRPSAASRLTHVVSSDDTLNADFALKAEPEGIGTDARLKLRFYLSAAGMAWKSSKRRKRGKSTDMRKGRHTIPGVQASRLRMDLVCVPASFFAMLWWEWSGSGEATSTT